MRQRQPQGLLLDQRLRLAIQLAALCLGAGGLALADQLVQLRVAVAREVQPGLHRGAGELRGEEVVRVAVVAGPAHEQQVMLAGLGAADQLAPLDHADFRLDADLGQVGLQQLGAERRVGVEQAARRAGPDGGLETVRQAGFGQQRAGPGGVVGIARQILGVTPGVRRVGAAGRGGAALEYGLEVAGLVEGQVDRLAHLRLVQRWVLAVEGDEGGHERRGFADCQATLRARCLHILRLRRQGNLAFAASELLQAHAGVGGDGEHQAVDGRLAGEVVGVGRVADHRVLLEALEHEGAGADRLGVQLLRRAVGQQFGGVLGGIDGGEAHAQGGEEGGVRALEDEAHAQRRRRLDALDQRRPLHGLGVRITAGGDLVPGMGQVEHALEAEQHVVGVQFTARG